MLKRLTGTAVAGLLVVGTMGALVTAPGAAVEPAPEPAASVVATAPEPDASAQPPAAPEFDSATPTTDSITVAWTWGPDAPAPEGVSAIIVRAEPGGHELRAAPEYLSATVTGLDAGTEYSITLRSSAGDLVGEPSEAVIAATLAEVNTGSDVVDEAANRPAATPGDVSSLIVTLKDDAAPAAQAQAATEELPVSGVEVADTQDLGAGNVRVDLSEGVSGADAALMIEEIESDPAVESVIVDQRVFRTAFPNDPPDDTYWTSNSLWGLYGTYGIGIASDRLTMNSVWTSSQGSGSVVAVLDTGSTVHPDLDANYVAGYDFVDNRTGSCRTGVSDSDGDYVDTATYGALGWDSNPLDPGDWTTVNTFACGYASSSSWHGTHVAGTVAAVGNNSAGVIGVAPQAQIQPVRVLSYDGGYTSDIVAGITWASGGSVSGVPANSTPADVINLSLGGYGSCSSTWQTAIDAAVARGSVVVVSAGNSTDDAANYSPASCNNVITVASSTSSGTLSSFSNYGSTVEITAPGSGIWSTLNSGSTTPVSASYTSYSGTSMAAPHVAGVAALLTAADNTRSPAQILSIIQSTALGFPTTGGWYDCTTSICGAGLLRAATTTTPVVYSISSQTGPIAGGTSVTLTGLNLGTATAVTFGGTNATIASQTSTTLTVTSPAHAAGAVDIVVTNPNGSGTSTDGFRYFDPPTAAGISLASGSTAGGDFLTITGTDLAPNDVQDSSWITVTFGGTAGTVWIPGTTSVTVSTPARAAGTVDVIVTTPGGSSTLPNAFTFVAPPSAPPSGGSSSGGGGSSSSSSDAGGGGALQEITEVRPAFGPVSGGNLVAIIGYGFTGATSVTIGGQAAAFRVINDATVEVTMPAAAAPGSADVAVNLTAARGRAFAPGGYVYRADLPTTATPTPTSGIGTTPSAPAPASTGAGEFVTFRANSAELSAATKKKLRNLASDMNGATVTGMVMTFSDARGTARSTALANQRARNIEKYLASSGVTADLVTEVTRGTTSSLRKGAIVRLSSEKSAAPADPSDRISSLIVRYTKGTAPTVNGAVRGANLVSGGLGAGMTLGPNLGLRMYRVDFAAPVTMAQAERAAAQMAKDKGVEFAEPDSIVQAQISRG